MNQNELLNFEQARYVFDNITEEVHFWKIIRNKNNTIKTWSLIYANKPALATWGIDELKEVIDKTTDDIFGKGASKHYLPIVNKIISQGKPHSYEDYFPQIDKYFRFTSIPLKESFITTGWDISDFIKRNKTLAKDKTQLKKQLASHYVLGEKVDNRSKEIENTNLKLKENIVELKQVISSNNTSNSKNLKTINDLVVKQSILVQENSRILHKLISAREEIKELREQNIKNTKKI